MRGVAGATQPFDENTSPLVCAVEATALCFVGVNGENSAATWPDEGCSLLEKPAVTLPPIGSRFRWASSAASSRACTPLDPPPSTMDESIANSKEDLSRESTPFSASTPSPDGTTSPFRANITGFGVEPEVSSRRCEMPLASSPRPACRERCNSQLYAVAYLVAELPLQARRTHHICLHDREEDNAGYSDATKRGLFRFLLLPIYVGGGTHYTYSDVTALLKLISPYKYRRELPSSTSAWSFAAFGVSCRPSPVCEPLPLNGTLRETTLAWSRVKFKLCCRGAVSSGCGC